MDGCIAQVSREITVRQRASVFYSMIVVFTLGTGGRVVIAKSDGASATSKTLTAQLQEKAKAAEDKTPAAKRAIMQKALEELAASDITKKALTVGAKAPTFELPDVKRGTTSLSSLLKKGPVVLTFYRGGWCPYCNIQLHDLQKHLSEMKKQGAELVAVSPQSPDASLSTVQKAELSFYVLSDAGGKVARQYGLMYALPKDLQELYLEFGIDLSKVNADGKWELPLSATYVIDQSGTIRYSFVNTDYKKRAETLDILKVLRSLKR